MSTPEPFGVRAGRPTGRVLFWGLFDDAAVFPPELTPLPQAVLDHVARQSSSCADLVGPLLLPASAIDDLLELDHPWLEVALVGLPGSSSTALVGEALYRLEERPAVTVIGVEIIWSPDWHRTDSWGILRSIEVPRGAGLEDALTDIQVHADDANPVQAKLQTGSTQEQPAPTSTDLAIFIRECVHHDLSFKLTGGLHHAISRTTSAGEDQPGFLNVIAATWRALSEAAGVPELDSMLSQRDPATILKIITSMSDAEASVVRAFFTSYGCCGVLDPVGDLAALGLIRETNP